MTSTIEHERAFVAEAAGNYQVLDSPWERAVRQAALNVIRPLLRPRGHNYPSILEFGIGDGGMSQLLSPLGARHVVVDGSRDFLERAKSLLPDTTEFVEALFEEFNTREKFDLIVACFVLEHVIDPSGLIRRMREFLRPDGKLFLAVPNIRSQSRLLARTIGIVDRLEDITDVERIHGHRRSYDRCTFDRDIVAGGAAVLQRGGLMLKPFGNRQLDSMITTGLLNERELLGLERLGFEYPDLCAALYVVAE